MQAERKFTREQWQAPVDKAIAEADGDLGKQQEAIARIKRKRPANHASHFGIEYENVHALTGKLMGTHNDRYGSVWS